MSYLLNQLKEMRTLKQAPAVWREQTRERLLGYIQTQASVKYTARERFVLHWQHIQLALAPLPLARVAVSLAVLLVAAVPFTQAAYQSLPGTTLYPFKRLGERVELTLKPTASAQGLYHLQLADNRLQELAIIKNSAPTALVAKIMRDYNVAVGFAQASVQAAVPTKNLAVEYNVRVDKLTAQVRALDLPTKDIPAYSSALAITNKLNRDSLSLLVSLHQAGRDGDLPAVVANRLQNYITKLETKLAGVDRQITSLQTTRSPKVVIESKQTVVPVREASRQAKTALTEAKQLVAKNLFTLALQKVEEGEDITTRTENAVTKKEDVKPDAETKNVKDDAVLPTTSENVDTGAGADQTIDPTTKTNPSSF